jgi:hypothetical protein
MNRNLESAVMRELLEETGDTSDSCSFETGKLLWREKYFTFEKFHDIAVYSILKSKYV